VEDVAEFEERADRLEPTGAFTALEATAEFAHLLAGGAAHTGTPGLSEDDADFLGLPGFSPRIRRPPCCARVTSGQGGPRRGPGG